MISQSDSFSLGKDRFRRHAQQFFFGRYCRWNI